MNEILRSGLVKARKEYHGDGSDYFDFAMKKGGYDLNEFKEIGFTKDEIQSILNAKGRNWRIQKGEIHYCQVGVYDGEMYTYRCISAIHDICVKYDLYRED